MLKLVRTALIAAIYFCVTYVTAGFSFGAFQLRIAEAITILPVFMIEGVFGITLGCFIANLALSPFGIVDALLGTLVTLAAALLTRLLRKRIYLAVIPPIILNALIIPLIIRLFSPDVGYLINALWIALSQSVAVCAVGIPLYYGLKNKPIIKSIDNRFFNRN